MSGGRAVAAGGGRGGGMGERSLAGLHLVCNCSTNSL